MAPFTTTHALRALLVSLGAIALSSTTTPTTRHQVLVIATGFLGGVYLDGGFGIWEFPFSLCISGLAFKGLQGGSYGPLAVAWALHTGWDVLHHRRGKPLVEWIPMSSAECAITDLVVAGWMWGGARGWSD